MTFQAEALVTVVIVPLGASIAGRRLLRGREGGRHGAVADARDGSGLGAVAVVGAHGGLGIGAGALDGTGTSLGEVDNDSSWLLGWRRLGGDGTRVRLSDLENDSGWWRLGAEGLGSEGREGEG